MKINTLTLKNIGAYYGDHQFDFSTHSPTQNTVLIGGKNGAGKTTLLESFRIVLFGPLAYGYKTENDQYLQRIQSLLNKAAMQTGESSYQMILDFNTVENYERYNYVLTRRWTVKNEKIKEYVQILKNGIHLSERETELFQSKLREEMPPQLFELCLFDGEEISRIVSDGKIADYLKHSSKILFNLDLFENLELDLNNFKQQQFEKTNTSKEEAELHELEMKHNEYETLVSTTEASIEQLQETISAKEHERDNLKKDFEIHGGLVKDERDQLLSRVKEIEHIRESNTEEVKDFIANLSPFYLVKDLLYQVNEQMENEKSIETYDNIKSTLPPSQLQIVLDELESHGVSTEHKDQSELQNMIHDQIMNLLKPADEKIIHRASFEQRTQVQSVVNDIKGTDTKYYLNLLDKNQTLLTESQKLRKQIEQNDQFNDFSSLLDQIESLNQQIEQKKQILSEHHEQLQQYSDEVLEIDRQLAQVKQKLAASHKSESTLAISSNVMEVSKKFRQLQLQKKLKQVSIEAGKMIRTLFQKEQYISSLHIDAETLEVTLFDNDGETISKERLSAGEKELLMLSIIWAMFKCSGFRVPFIFDTLLGRLDKTHKEKMIQHFIPSCGEQVMILSTDTEIDLEHFKMLQPVVSKQYTLTFNNEKKQAEVMQGQYFDMTGMEMAT
ncbi:DNA sulfur modification protein DndD [Texcoconibacillus texcoconensis]|uniref:Nuclease SbcCD subunit C n=1 Tax=Texcoconibacillus texcoconensis TaxID=1095777 RepID=A0A840QM35_9BACI|nr:DNA sulfur modification protein DndD [Texcoconibacillus texcoconensis]MBB5172439.1 DNA sulfur modification protein DndD [Texcoconibacillus texcoconensis]